ncbi:Hypothetical predicted protein [Lynx pardinus]|uniref:Uncharacterized protein n=1 Tax=Lynx pardinus TaxID=191816 RepID=A0A485PAQ8_LYNPA|nr:Hypothetical predicted protein [Lynx pardinus]
MMRLWRLWATSSQSAQHLFKMKNQWWQPTLFQDMQKPSQDEWTPRKPTWI